MDRPIPGLWKQKPQAWGPAGLVSAVIAERIGDLYGIAWKDVPVLIPAWSPGDQSNYGDLNFGGVNVGGVFKNNSMYLNGTSYISLGDQGVCEDRDFTFLVAIKTTQTGIDKWWLSEASIASKNPLCGLINNDGSPRFFVRDLSKTSLEIIGSETINDGKLQVLCGTFKNPYGKLYVNGVLSGEQTQTLGTMGVNTSSIGGVLRSTIGLSVDGSCLFAMMLTTAISADVVAGISDNPYQLWQPPTFRTYFIPSGTPTTFNLASLYASQPTRIIQC